MYPPKEGVYYPPEGPPMTTGIPVNPSPTHHNYYASGGPAVPTTFNVQSQPPTGPWSTGLCDCGDDCGNCCTTCFCPCITFGQIAEIVDRGSTSCGASGALYTLIMCVTGCSCIYSCFYRAKMRGQLGLQESPCADCLVHCCCEPCALCQEYRELQRRGFDMHIGWHANMERQGRGMATVPPAVQVGMSR